MDNANRLFPNIERKKYAQALKKDLLACRFQSVTLQADDCKGCMDVAQSLSNDEQVLLLDIKWLLNKYRNGFVFSYSESDLSLQQEEFLYHVGLPTSVKGNINAWPELDQIRLHLAKELNSSSKIVVFINHTRAIQDFYELLSDVEVFLPKLKVLLLEYASHPLTDTIWQTDQKGRISKKEKSSLKV